jgi:transcriptional regulator with XRE-family HTH domain
MHTQIAIARRESGMTLAELARRMGVDVRTVARWQSPGGTKPNYARLVLLAEILDKSPSYFLDGEQAA